MGFLAQGGTFDDGMTGAIDIGDKEVHKRLLCFGDVSNFAASSQDIISYSKHKKILIPISSVSSYKSLDNVECHAFLIFQKGLLWVA
jgi:hypothetical protein